MICKQRARVSICYLELPSKWVMSANCCQCFTGRFFTAALTLKICSLCNQLFVFSVSSPKSGGAFPPSLLPWASQLPCQQTMRRTTACFWHQQFLITRVLSTNVFAQRKELTMFPGSEQSCQSHLWLSFEITLTNNFFKSLHTTKNNTS